MKKFFSKLCLIMLVMAMMISHILPVRVYANDEQITETSEVETVLETEVSEEKAAPSVQTAETAEEADKEEAVIEKTVDAVLTEEEEKTDEVIDIAPAAEEEKLPEEAKEDVKLVPVANAKAEQKDLSKDEKDPIVDVKLKDVFVVAVPINHENRVKKVVYNGEEQSYGTVSADDFYLEFHVGDEIVNHLPEGLEVTVEAYFEKETFELGKDILSGTNVGVYEVAVIPYISGKAEGYRYEPEGKGAFFALEIEPCPVTVTITGKSGSKVYDGDERFFGAGYDLSASNDLYDLKNVSIEFGSQTKVRSIVNVGTYTTGYSQTYVDNSFLNNDSNFEVTFVAQQGTFEITPAPLKIKSGSGRAPYEPVDGVFAFSVEEYEFEGLMERDEKIINSDKWNGSVDNFTVLDHIGTAENDFDYDLGTYPNSNQVSITANYSVTKELGEIEVYDPTKEAYIDVFLKLDEEESLECIYDGTEHSVKVESGKFIVSTKNENYDPASIVFVGEPFKVYGTDAGEYPINLTEEMFVNTDQNFEKVYITVHSEVMEISPEPVDVSVRIANEEVEYTGETITIPTYTITKVGYPLGSVAEYDYEAYCQYSGQTTISGKELGIYSAEFNQEALVNTNDNFQVTFSFIGEETAYLSIVQPKVTVIVHGTEFEQDYSGSEQTMVIKTDGSVWINGKKQSQKAFTLECEGYDTSKIALRKEITISGTDAGEYLDKQWYYYLAGNDQSTNVRFSIEQDPALLINPVALRLEIKSATMNYGDELPEFTAVVSGLIGSDEAPDYELNVIYKGDEKPMPVGKYTIDLGESGKTANYYFDSEKVTTGTLSVNQRPVTVTIKGNRETVRENGSLQTLTGWTAEFNDELFKESFIKGPAAEDYPASGTIVGNYYMHLPAEKFESAAGSNFDVKFEVDDGVLNIVSEDTVIEIGTLTLTGWEGTFDGEEHPATVNTEAMTAGGYTVVPAITYTKGETSSEEAPLHAGEYEAVLTVKVYDADGNDVTAVCNITVGDPVKVIIEPKPIRVVITAEKKLVLHDGKVHRASYTAEIIGNDLEKYRFEESDIVYAGTCYVEESRYTDNLTQYGGVPRPTLQLQLNNFSSSNSDYDVSFSFNGNGLIILDIEGRSNSGDWVPIKFAFSTNSLVYNGQTQTYHPTIVGYYTRTKDGKDVLNNLNVGNTGIVTINVRSYNYYSNYKSFRVTVDLDKFAVSGKDAGTYRLSSAAVEDAIVSITCTENVMNTAVGFDCSEIVFWYYQDDTLTITKRPLTITVNDGIRKNYGDPDPDKSTWISYDGLADGDNIFDLVTVTRDQGENVRMDENENIQGYLIKIKTKGSGGGSSWPGEQEVVKKAGRVEAERVVDYVRPEVEIEQPGDTITPITNTTTTKNYEINADSQGYLYIYPIPLVIKPDYKEKWYGQKDPVLTYTVTGLVGSEYLSEGYVSIWRAPGEAVGRYLIEVSCDRSLYPDKPIEDDFIEIIDEPGIPIVIEKDVEEAYDEEEKEVAMKSEKRVAYEAVEARPEQESAYEEIVKPIEWIDDEYIPTVSTPGSGRFHPVNYIIDLQTNWLVIKDTNPTPDPDPDPTPDPDPVVTFTVTYILDGGTITGTQTVFTDLLNGDITPSIEEPVREGYTFKGWSPVVSETVTGDATYVAQWEPVELLIVDNDPPLANGAAWALVNLLSAIATVVTGSAMLITYFKKKEEEEEDEKKAQQVAVSREEEEKKEEDKRRKSKFFGILPAVAAVIAFILTEDMRLPMILVDKWTLLMLIILGVNLILAFLTRNKDKDEDEEQEKVNQSRVVY